MCLESLYPTQVLQEFLEFFRLVLSRSILALNTYSNSLNNLFKELNKLSMH